MFLLAVLAGACAGQLEDRLSMARAMQDVGEFADSIEPLRAVLDQEPGHPEANYRLGVALIQTGQASSAIWPLERSREAPEQAVQSNLLLLSTYMTLRDYEHAVEAADRVLELEPAHGSALLLRAQAKLGAKQEDAAIADLDRLMEADPSNLQAILTKAVALADLGRLEEAEEWHHKFEAAAAEEPAMRGRACLAVATFYRDYPKDLERATREVERCLAENPEDPSVLQEAVEFYEREDQPEKALALLQQRFETNPEDFGARNALANRLRSQGRTEEGEQLLVEAVEAGVGPTAWLALARFRKAAGDSTGALEALEGAIEAAGGINNDEVRFQYADLLLDAGQTERAEQQAAELTEPIYRQMIQGRLRFEAGDHAGALKILDEALVQWPDNAGARFLAGWAAAEQGQSERAISHLREAVRADARGTDAALLLSRLYLERGEYNLAARFARRHIRARSKETPEAYVFWARALAARGNYEGARRAAERLGTDAGRPLESAVELAAIERAASGPEKALGVIEAAGLDLSDPENEAALRSALDDLLALDRKQDALARIDEALAAHPEVAGLHELRGRVLVRAGDVEQGRRAFEEALALEPENARALTGLATLDVVAGERARALERFDRAAAADPEDPTAAYYAAQLVLGAGDRKEAESRLRRIAQGHPGHAGARNDLAWLLAQDGRELPRALVLAQDAVRIDPSAATLDTLGYVHLKRGEHADAVDAFERSLAADPQAASVRYHLALALLAQGEKERARSLLEEALGSGPFPEAEQARSELARLGEP